MSRFAAEPGQVESSLETRLDGGTSVMVGQRLVSRKNAGCVRLTRATAVGLRARVKKLGVSMDARR